MEKINVFDKSNPTNLIAADRKEYYNKQIELHNRNELPTEFVEVVNILLFNTKGQIALQKRALNKRHNPGLLDKAIGGHVTHGDTVTITVMQETLQELGTPAYVFQNIGEFEKATNLLAQYLDKVSLVVEMDTIDFFPEKIIDGKSMPIGNRSHLFFGVYNGAISFRDSESTGIIYYSIQELKDEMQQKPTAFTNDIKIYVLNYEEKINKFIELITKI